MNYQQFIETKRHRLDEYGFEPVFMPKTAFGFQETIIAKAVKKGRMGMFADTGLGKTLMQLAIAQNIVIKTES